MKFTTARFLRSHAVDIPLIFLLWRLARLLSEPTRSRCVGQLRKVLQFRGADRPPANIPIRLRLCSDDMVSEVCNWLLGFTAHHQSSFPPLHKPRAPFVCVKQHTIAQCLLDFRRHLRSWLPTGEPECTCHLFPDHIRRQPRQTTHICAFAHQAFPKISFFCKHTAEEILPTYQDFFSFNCKSLETWLHRWKLPSDLIQYWQTFLRHGWNTFQSSHQYRASFQELRQARKIVTRFVSSPADHFPNSILLSCPCQWHPLLLRTFKDSEVFLSGSQLPAQVLSNTLNAFPAWICKKYKWAVANHKCLSSAYILPKPSRQFQKARPSVDCSHSWALPLGSALAVILLEMAKIVFPFSLHSADIATILADVRLIFSQWSTVESDLTLEQQDIAGFYNQVEHSRIIASIEFMVCQYSVLTGSKPTSILQAHMTKSERLLRVFRGHWRGRSRQYRALEIQDLVPLVRALLEFSVFHVGLATFRQTRGASMGSQWAPVLCSSVALHREHTFAHV